MTTDPILTAAREVLQRSFADIRLCVEGLTTEALDWHPGGDDTNSIAVLATHSLHSTRSWLSVALGEPLPERDRDSEFRVSALDAESLLRLLDDISRDCLALVSKDGAVDWSALRRTHPRPRAGAPEQVPAAWALLHALEHLREHVGQISLTRQLWEARSPAP